MQQFALSTKWRETQGQEPGRIRAGSRRRAGGDGACHESHAFGGREAVEERGALSLLSFSMTF